MPDLCLCSVCPNGTPYQWKVTISGTGNSACTDCNHANGDFILAYNSPCHWQLPVSGICSVSATLKLYIAQNAGGGNDMTVELDSQGGATTWTATNIADCFSAQTLSLISGS